MTPSEFAAQKFAWLEQVATDTNLPSQAARIAILISQRINYQTGEAFPSLETLAQEIAADERTVRRAIEAMCKAGHLNKKRGGDGRSNRYSMMISDRTPVSTLQESRPDTIVHSEEADRTFETLRLDIPDTQTGHQCPPNPLSNPSKKEICRKPRKSYPENFETFWNNYPTDPGMSKQEAWKEWSKLPEEDQTAANGALPAFRAWAGSQGPNYRMLHSCRYLSQRRFDGFRQHATGPTGNVVVPFMVFEATDEWAAWKAHKGGRLNAYDLKDAATAKVVGRGFYAPSQWPPKDTTRRKSTNESLADALAGQRAILATGGQHG